jgi:M6 family metalloprotease-like protein
MSTVTIPFLDPKDNSQSTEGQTDFSLYVEPKGRIRAVMVFVTFKGASASAHSPADVARSLLGNGLAEQLFHQQSYQNMTLDVDVKFTLGWRRMSKPSEEYATHDFDRHKQYIAEAIALFPTVNFSKYELVFIATPADADLAGASSFTAPKGAGVPSPRGEIRLVVTFDGGDHRRRYTTLVHEVGHLFGLPDTYLYCHPPGMSQSGCWDLMSDVFHATSFLGWHRHKNGWLDSSRKTYVADSRIEWTEVLHPLSDTGGLSMVVFPVDDPVNPSKVFVLELAQEVEGEDGSRLGEGVLFYVVDATAPSGSLPVVIVPRIYGVSENFGNLFEAPYGVGDRGRRAEDKAVLELEVLEKLGDSYRVKVRYERQ